MSDILSKALNQSLDRYRKLRLGQLSSDIDENGEVTVKWLDGEPGGQSNLVISYPGFNNAVTTPYGIEVGYGKGTVGVFGFITDGHAVLLCTIISKIKGKQVGYDKTGKIKSGEFRATSKTGSNLFLDENGNVNIDVTNQIVVSTNSGISMTFGSDGKIDLITPEEINIKCKKFTIQSDAGTNTF